MKQRAQHLVTIMVAAFCLSAATLASAQTPTLPEALGEPCAIPVTGKDPSRTAAMTRAYQSGKWTSLKSHVSDIRKLFERSGTCDQGVTALDYFVVVWVAETELGETALLNAIVHDSSPEGYVSRLPGLSAGDSPKLYQLFVSDGPGDALAAVYMSTREENPLLQQIPDVAAKILDPLLALLSSSLGVEQQKEARAKGRAPAPSGWATLSRVNLPYARAAVKIDMKAAIAPTAAGLTQSSTTLRQQLTLTDVPHSDSAKQLAIDFDKLFVENVAGCVDPATPSCLSTLDPLFGKRYNGTCAKCSQEDAQAQRLVDTKYRALAAGIGEKELEGAAELRNVPFTKYSFGLMTAFTFFRWSNAPRVKVDEAVLAYDPLDRQMTMATFNGAFRPYDADAFSMTPMERHRWFVGAAITPTFGIGAGYSYLPIRGLGINAGYVLLGTSTPAGSRQVGEEPENTNDPFKLGVTGAAFLGVSYNFK